MIVDVQFNTGDLLVLNKDMFILPDGKLSIEAPKSYFKPEKLKTGTFCSFVSYQDDGTIIARRDLIGAKLILDKSDVVLANKFDD